MPPYKMRLWKKVSIRPFSQSLAPITRQHLATGNVEVGGITYAWKISALPLNEVYSVNGLPEDAIYVGIRFTS